MASSTTRLARGGEALGGIAAGQTGTHALLDDLHDHVIGRPASVRTVWATPSSSRIRPSSRCSHAHVAVAQLTGCLLGKPQGLLPALGENLFSFIVSYLPFHGKVPFTCFPFCSFVSGLQRPDLVPQLRRPLKVLLVHSLLHLQLQRVHLAQIGKSGSGPPGLPGRPSFLLCLTAAGQERRSGPASRRRSRQRGPPASSFSAPSRLGMGEKKSSKKSFPKRLFPKKLCIIRWLWAPSRWV